MKNTVFIKDDLHRVSLDSFLAPSVVDPEDLNALRRYRDTAKELLELADSKEVEEGLKLLEKVRWHLAKIDLLLEKYEDGPWFNA